MIQHHIFSFQMAYVVTMKWAYRDHTRKMMEGRSQKRTRLSWIEVKNAVHPFFTADRVHPLADQIDKYLVELNDRLDKIGYWQENYFLFHEE